MRRTSYRLTVDSLILILIFGTPTNKRHPIDFAFKRLNLWYGMVLTFNYHHESFVVFFWLYLAIFLPLSTVLVHSNKIIIAKSVHQFLRFALGNKFGVSFLYYDYVDHIPLTLMLMITGVF